MTALDILTVIPEHKTGKRQIFVDVRPVKSLIVNLDVVQLLGRRAFKSPIAFDGKSQRAAIR